MSTHTLWSTDFAYFHSRLKYVIIFWGRDGEIIKVFQLQKQVIRLIIGVHKREYCRHIFRKFRILTLTSLYILEVLCFIKKYQGYLKQNFGMHGHNTGNKSYLNLCYCSTILYQRSATHMSIKLPIQIKQLDNYKGFKREVKTFLLITSIYMIEEFFAL